MYHSALFCVFENLRLRHSLRDPLTSSETEIYTYLDEFFAFTSEGNAVKWYIFSIIAFEALIDTMLILWGLWRCGGVLGALTSCLFVKTDTAPSSCFL